MAQEAASWLYEDLHKDRPYHDGSFTRWSSERTVAFPYGARDGVDIVLAETDVAPHDLFTTRESASPVPPEQQ